MPSTPAINGKLSQILADLRHGLEALYGNRLIKILLYGSHARGEARPWSDIDVAVVLRGVVDRFEERERTSELVADLSLETDTNIHCKFVSEEDFLWKDDFYLANVRQEGIQV